MNLQNMQIGLLLFPNMVRDKKEAISIAFQHPMETSCKLYPVSNSLNEIDHQ